MGVGGGAWYPPAQGGLADAANTRRSYLVPVSGYLAMTIYAVGLVIDQARKDKFRIRNFDKLAVSHVATADALPPAILVSEKASPLQSEKQKYRQTDEQIRDNTDGATLATQRPLRKQ
ncbi:hypothetical protein PILCRDRAFT_809930 [Piloderma croceum F 1598]|uniref:Uncharacterized protein n=1 Tax=Piloderma croceum (strain F 1598) TaxID=765440 RepID=A0A0C3G6Q0_PILCF|nr:hypothetical protein PILCRDRAFT_809930 [Piloderma croceum F 1598]